MQLILKIYPFGLFMFSSCVPKLRFNLLKLKIFLNILQETQELVTKTFMTTYTYLTTLLEKGETLVSSREEVVSNVVTEERRPSVQVTPTPVTKVCCIW